MELFKVVSRVSPIVVEYWLVATERVMNDLDYTLEHKLKGALSLFHDEAYQWWLTVEEGTQLEQLT